MRVVPRLLRPGLLLFAIFSGCSAPPSDVKVIVGAKITGKPDLAYSVVVIDHNKFRAVGAQSDVPVPKGSEITSGLGKILEGDAIEAGQPANLVLRDASTGLIERTMRNGEWSK